MATLQETALVAEDNDEDRAFFADRLREDGLLVEATGSGYKACELIAQKRFDLIVTDLVMPGASGFQVLAAARSADPESICIALTSYGSLDSALDSLRFGAYSYLLKPCDAASFRHCVQRGLEKRRLTKELRLRNEQLQAANRDLDAKVQEATRSLRDLNHRMLTEMASLREVDELKSAFLRNVSHDLRGPVAATMGYLSLLKEQADTMPAPTANLVARAQRASTQLDYLIGQLVEAARLESGKVQLFYAAVDVADLIEEAAATFKPQADAAGLRLLTRCAPGPGLVLQADRGRLLQALNNLIGNACKFTPRGGSVQIAAEGGNPTRFCVEDNGPGIEPRHIARIFEKFYQVEDSEGQGLGLGLRIAKDIVELHKGRIWVESQPGKGARFFFEIP